jgi:hypothetical protein
VKEEHRRITEIALAAAGESGLALAGGYAIRAHGMGNRPSQDVDLFADWHRRTDFSAIVELVVGALERNGYTVSVGTRFETFARLFVAREGHTEAEPNKLELSADWRSHPPVQLDIGPVLHPDDAVANKMCALYGRAEPRDFLDIDAVLVSGRYSRERLLQLTADADGGFDPVMFAGAVGSLEQLADSEFEDYDVTPDQVTRMRERFARWRDELLAGGDGPAGAA